MNKKIDSMANGISSGGSGIFKGSLVLTGLLCIAILLSVYNKIIYYTDIPFFEPPVLKTFSEHYDSIVNNVVPTKNKKYFI